MQRARRANDKRQALKGGSMTSIGPDDQQEEIFRREAASGTGASALRREHEKSMKIVTGGSLTEALAGGGAVVLAILGLAGILPWYMTAIAVIAIGVALLAQGSTAAARWSRIIEETGSSPWGNRLEVGSGLSAELFG